MAVTVAPGRLFAGYRIEAVAGRGGMGVVYRAVQEGLERPVALKLIAPELARDPEFRARFVRESRLAASLDHPHVIPVYEAGEEDDTLFIAMRWVDGPDLRALVVGQGPLSLVRAATLVAQVAGALEAAHARGLVHRDVKPANVLLAGGEAASHAYLSDFGLARSEASSDRLTRTGGVLGTAAYSSPEQIEGGALDGRADVYALACVLFFALTGRPPFRRDTELATAWAQVHEQPPTLHAAGVDVPVALELALGRALAKDPAERPESAAAFAAAVAAAAGGAGTPATSSTASTHRLGGVRRPGASAPTVRLQRSGARKRWLRWLAGLVAVGAAGAVLAVVLLDSGSGGGGAKQEATRTTSAAPPAKPTGPPDAAAAGDVVRCAVGLCRQDGERVAAPVQDAGCGSGGSWQRLDGGGEPALFACLGGASAGLGTVPTLAGARLDRAEAFLDERGIDHDTDGGGSFGIVVRENWTVCATEPVAGDPATGGAVTLFVDRYC